jgi:hypothetical protein
MRNEHPRKETYRPTGCKNIERKKKMHGVNIMLQYKHCKTVEKMSAFFFRKREDVTKSGNSKSEVDPIGKGLNIFILILHAYSRS